MDGLSRGPQCAVLRYAILAMSVALLCCSLGIQAFASRNCQTQDRIDVCLDRATDINGNTMPLIYVNFRGGHAMINPYDPLHLGISVNGSSGTYNMLKDGGTRGMNPTGFLSLVPADFATEHGPEPEVTPELFANYRPGTETQIEVYFESAGQYYSNYGQNFHFYF